LGARRKKSVAIVDWKFRKNVGQGKNHQTKPPKGKEIGFDFDKLII
jgi:hypothetical protein